MSAPVTSPALEQEARRVLRKLAENGAYIAATGTHSFGLFVRRNGFARPVLKLESVVVKCLSAQGFIAPLRTGKDGAARYAISADGESHLRRASVSHDPFGAQHRVMGTRQIELTRHGQSVRHVVNLAETPLGWLASRRGPDGKPMISQAQFEAGERLREDYTRAQIMKRVTVDWSLPLSGEGPARGSAEKGEIGDSALDARERLDAALAAAGRDLSSLLIDVCCHLKGLEEAERARHWPARTAKVVLRIGLSRLAEHYGLEAQDKPPPRLRHWRAAPALAMAALDPGES
jgi:hypothetical protein